ncbi:hypothetical protein Bhyg_07766, partial [Pseudolycoriella hygida]
RLSSLTKRGDDGAIHIDNPKCHYADSIPVIPTPNVYDDSSFIRTGISLMDNRREFSANEREDNAIQPSVSKRNQTSMYYQNVRGLGTKMKESSTGCNGYIIALTVTGLHTWTYNGDDHERLGGVVVASKSNISSAKISVPHAENVELVTCVVSTFRPDHQSRMIDFIDMNADDRLYVLGDFNMANVCWIRNQTDDNFLTCDVAFASNSFLPINVDSSAHADLYSLIGSGLCQTNHVQNYHAQKLCLSLGAHYPRASQQ